MSNEQTKIIYDIYSRKSSESEDRQILSIPAQNDELTQLADKTGRIVRKIQSESKSAKDEGRAIFNQLIQDIKAKHIQGIIVWHPDRLSRNAMDAARLIDLLDKGLLIEIVTPTQVFKNTPMDKFMFSLLTSQAKMDNDNKGINVKRGMRAKAKLGIYPSSLPTGYLSVGKTKGNRQIESDPVRLPLIKKMMKMFLTGSYSAQDIRDIMNNEWGFTMPNGKGICRSSIYNMLTNTFYIGKYEYPKRSGEWYDGSHEQIITDAEYDTIQVILGRKGKPRPKNHVFDFTGLMKCGECGASITAEAKCKRPKNGKVHHYIYYHCTKRVNLLCTQGCIEQKQLEKQIVDKIEEIEIPQEFHNFAMKWFKSENEKVFEESKAIINAQEKAYKACIRKLENLANMRADQELTAEEYTKMKLEELEKKSNLESARNKIGQDINHWIETGDEMLTFVEQCKHKFKNGGRQLKRELLCTLGSNLIVFNKKLNINLTETLLPLEKISPVVREIKDRLEPINNQVNQEDFDALCHVNPIVLASSGSELLPLDRTRVSRDT